MKHTTDIQILYIITKLELGGAQKVCLSLHEGLTQQKATALLISNNAGILIDKIKDKSNVILLNSLQREISWRTIIDEVRCVFQLMSHIKKLKKKFPHLIVHTHSTKAGLLGRWAAFLTGVKHRIHTIHGYAFHEQQSKVVWFGIYACELLTSFITTHFICVSSEDVKTGIRFFPRFEKKHSIIRASIDLKQFTPAVLTPFPENKAFIFGTIACFKPQKNLFDLLQAFNMVHQQNPNTYLEIIGDGQQRSAIESWISSHKLSQKITLHGWQNAVAPLMMNWHSFVLSSLWEGLPCSIVEARLLKLPVLCYNTGGIHEVITDQENGFLYKKGDWQSLAHGMLSISREKNIYKKLQSYQDNLDDFDSTQMIFEHIQLYKRFIKHT